MNSPRNSFTAPIPSLKGGLPLFGHALEFWRDPVSLIQHGRDRHGDVFAFQLFGRTMNVFTGIGGATAVLKSPDTVLSARDAYRFTVPIFGRGIAYDAPPELMDQQLSMIHPALRDERMQRYGEFIAAEVADHVEIWGDSGEVDLLETMNEITIRSAGRCLIGANFGTSLASRFAALYHDLQGGINMVAFFAPGFPTLANRRRDRARRELVELMAPLIAQRRASGRRCDDFLDTLITSRSADGMDLNDDTITGLLLTLLFAGQHTSAVLATWTGLLLLQSPRHLAPVLAEQTEVLASEGMTLAALKQLIRLERCIKEAERMHPPLTILIRKVLKDFEFGAHRVPAGEYVIVSPAVSHRNPEIFADPCRYDPDRFAVPREEDRRTPNALIGFGGGKHRCIGLAFAYQQIKVIWSVLLQRYSFELVDKVQGPDYTTFVVGPRQPCRVRYSCRVSSRQTASAAFVS